MATSVTLKPNAIDISGSTSGTTTLQASAVAGTTTLTLPAATDTLVGKATTDTLTNKTLTGAAMNGTLGATTPSTASVTTLTTSSTVTHSGGTANGVAYLDGSKVLTTGSALVFDGTNLLVGTTSGSARLTLRATSGSLGTFTQTSATGYGIGIVPGADTVYEAFFINNAANTLNQIRMFGNGNATFAGAVSKGSGSFRIDHPLPQLEETHQLVHSFIEGPQADLIYRGKVNLVNGTATVNIDLASGMTEGTFEALCREVQCFTTNESGWNHVRGSVTGNTLTIECQDQTASDLISWMVIGERKDKHMMDTDWTDDNGKVIIEPLKPAHRPIEETQERTSA